MDGLMQTIPLTLDRIFDYARDWHGRTEIVSRDLDGTISRTDYAAANARARRFSTALTALGVQPGDRVATLAWNGARHLEAWYAIMGIGAVCHTLNPRLFIEQLVYIVNHAQDRLLIADAGFADIIAPLLARCPSIERVIILGDDEVIDIPNALASETLIASATVEAKWGGFGENTAAGLCYTSGTTGDPKGALYSHRSNYLHTLNSIQPNMLALSSRDVVLPIVPMFHANAWGLAFSCPAVGAKMVMPGRDLSAPAIFELIDRERVTFAAAVPTVWQALMHYLDETGARLDSLERVTIGGSAVPESLVIKLRDVHGVQVYQGWGMTENSPLGTLSTPTAAVAAMPEKEQLGMILKQGRPPMGVDLRIVDDEGNRLPHDGVAVGRLMLRGHATIRAYYRRDDEILDAEGFFDTGDVGTIDEHGFLNLTDRAKDVIKSGGEWISSIAIENEMTGHAAVAVACAIGVPHDKWGERPLLFVQLRPGEAASPADLTAYLDGRIPKWWLPDAVHIVDDIPLGATGKIDKKRVRAEMLQAA
jgi:fatty-acyl-CoA synthase